MRKLPLVAVILLNWNRLLETLPCLESLKRLHVTGFRLMVIVVDNGSRSNPTQLIRRAFRAAVVIRSDRNLGFSGGNNLGIRYALKSGADSVWLLNNDTRPAPDCLRQLVRAASSLRPAEKPPRFGIVISEVRGAGQYQILSPVIFELGPGGTKTQRIQFAGGMIDWVRGTGRAETKVLPPRNHPRNDTEGIWQTGFVPGTAMLIRREVFERIGYLDETYFAYNEDTDFSFRAERAGFCLGVVQKARIWHKLATSSGPKSALFWYLNCRNKWLFMKAHAKAWQWPFFLLHYVWKPLIYRFLALMVRPSSENRAALLSALGGTRDGMTGQTGRPPARLLTSRL